MWDTCTRHFEPKKLTGLAGRGGAGRGRVENFRGRGSHFPRGRGGAGRGVHPWYIYQHEARVVTRSFDVCLNSNVDDTNTMAMQGNKDVVFPRTSVMNALAVCSIDFNSKLQIETSDGKIILVLTWNDSMLFWHRMYVLDVDILCHCCCLWYWCTITYNDDIKLNSECEYSSRTFKS